MTSKQRRSVKREIGADKVRTFSAFPDLLQFLIDEKQILSWDDLVENHPELLFDLIFQWYREGQIACVFAMRLAHDAAKARWRSEIVKDFQDVSGLNARIDELLPECEAIQFIYPGIFTATQVAGLIAQLCTTDRWSAYEIPWKFQERARSIQIGLRWNPPDRSYTSWVLGLAPFEPMPFTRRLVGAPFTVLVLRPKAPSEPDPARAQDSVLKCPAAHLAHMDDQFGDDEAMRAKIKQLTINNKRSLLASNCWSTARAQVTFSLPLWCREIVSSVLIQQLPDDERVDLR